MYTHIQVLDYIHTIAVINKEMKLIDLYYAIKIIEPTKRAVMISSGGVCHTKVNIHRFYVTSTALAHPAPTPKMYL